MQVDYTPSKVGLDFLRSASPVRCIIGPVGSGKSALCCMEVFRRCAEMPKCKDGKRRSRWVIVRNTSAQLTQTTLKTWTTWFPDGVAGYWKTSERTFFLRVGDIDAEILFLPLDTPDDQRKLLSLEVTGVFINEAREVHPELVIAARSRMPRYPSKSMLAIDPATKKPFEYWSGLIMDTNPPSEDSWLYEQFEVKKPTGWELFRQPSGLSPLAENRDNLGKTYYEDMMAGATEDFIRVHVHGEYGRSLIGRPVYEKSFVKEYHVALSVLKHIDYDLYPIIIGMDFGRTPAAVFLQRDARGRILVLDAIYVENIGLKGFLQEHVKPLLSAKFPANRYLICGDPAGWAKSQLSEENVEDVFKAEGLKSIRAPTNDPTKRIASVEKALAGQINGGPLLLFSASTTSDGMKHLNHAMYGGYKYRRKTNGTYETEPLKDEFSHCFVGGTLVSTPAAPVPIEDLSEGAYVVTPFGPRRVTSTLSRTVFELTELTLSDGTRLVSSTDHPYYTDKGLVPASFLRYSDVLLQQGENSEGFAPRLASPPHGATPGSTTSSEHAASVDALSKLIAMRALKPAPKIVGVRSYPVPSGALVHDLTVDDVHAFYVSGVLVANCSDALQYGTLCIDSGGMAAAFGSTRRPVRVASAAGWT